MVIWGDDGHNETESWPKVLGGIMILGISVWAILHIYGWLVQ